MIKEKETIQTKLAQFIFPQYCISCGKYGNYLCDRCLYIFPQNLPECYLCRVISQNSQIHHKCNQRSRIQIVGAITLYQYTEPAKKIMKKLKYEGSYVFQHVIELMIIKKLKLIKRFIHNFKRQKIYLIPIPLHKIRQLKRGYNQAKLIAQIFEKLQIGILQNNILSKISNTKSQVKKDKSLRENSLNPFKALHNNKIKQKDIFLIIDDVMTTGATITLATEAISHVYSNPIYAITLFRPIYRGKKRED